MSEPDVLGYTLSGQPIVRTTGLSRQLAKMHGRYGRAPEGVTCGTCIHLRTEESGSRRHYFKCERYGRSRSTATDWRKKWPACARHEPADDAGGVTP